MRSEHQIGALKRLQGNRRVHIVGAAGTGKTMLAAEKARRLAREGFETLLVCFNQPLARLLLEETEEAARTSGRLTVSTFHQLYEDLGHEAKTLPPKPNPVTPEWFSKTLARGFAVSRSTARMALDSLAAPCLRDLLWYDM